jgi:hypothetical protein
VAVDADFNFKPAEAFDPRSCRSSDISTVLSPITIGGGSGVSVTSASGERLDREANPLGGVAAEPPGEPAVTELLRQRVERQRVES